jgi:hypothetical protein
VISSSRANPFINALDGDAFPLHSLINWCTSIFNFSARSVKVRECLLHAVPMVVDQA